MITKVERQIESRETGIDREIGETAVESFIFLIYTNLSVSEIHDISKSFLLLSPWRYEDGVNSTQVQTFALYLSFSLSLTHTHITCT